jgi:DNA-binding MarR family transcriptional regulator
MQLEVGRETAAARRQWKEARTFESKARRALAPEGISFSDWLVLEGLLDARAPMQEGVYQTEVARHTGLSERVVSASMVKLDGRGLVDRGPGEDPRSWAVLLTRKGVSLLRRCRDRLDLAGLGGTRSSERAVALEG